MILDYVDDDAASVRAAALDGLTVVISVGGGSAPATFTRTIDRALDDGSPSVREAAVKAAGAILASGLHTAGEAGLSFWQVQAV